MRNQIKLTYYIGVAKPHPVEFQQFKKDVVRAACRCCGGCTALGAYGYWIDGAHERKDLFYGCIENEFCLRLELTCEWKKRYSTLTYMKDAIIQAARIYNIDTDWVHVVETEIIGHHFSVAEGH